MEKEVKIHIPSSRKYIYGTLRGSLRRPLVIFVHGLTGHRNEHIFFNGAKFFDARGFSSFRFNLYHWKKDARNLSECTLRIHATDLDTVVEHFRKKGVKKVFVVGHSYGGPTVLLSQRKDFEGIVLWDSSYDAGKNLFHDARFVKGLHAYLLRWGYEVIISRGMVEEARKLRWDTLMKNLNVPIKIICAGKGALISGGKKYFKNASEPKAFKVIRGAGHTFDEYRTEEILFKETLGWFRKVSSKSL